MPSAVPGIEIARVVGVLDRPEEGTSITDQRRMMELLLSSRHAAMSRGSPMRENPSRLTVDEVKDLINQGQPVAFVDSRNPIAWGSSKVKLPGAHRIPIDEVERHLPALPRDRHLIVYCT
jgi:hypothetical protein